MLYLCHGPDDFFRAEKITQLKAAMGGTTSVGITLADTASADLNVTTLDGPGLALNDIRHHTDTLPFFVSKRLVIVRHYLAYVNNRPDDLQALLDYLPHLPASADLVFEEKDTLDPRHPVLKLAHAQGAVYFAGLDPNNLQPWIVKRAKELGAAIEPRAAAMLGRLVGARLRILNNELEKLTLYVNGERPISPADVELLVPYTEEAEKFGMSNAIGKRDARRAYDQLHKELDEGRHPMAIMGSIAAQVRALIEVKDMAERGMSPAAIAQTKGWRSDYAAKARLQEAANFSMARLEQILEMLLAFDVAIKTGKIDSMLALDTLIARLCTAR